MNQNHSGSGHNASTYKGDIILSEPTKTLSILSEIVNILGNKLMTQSQEQGGPEHPKAFIINDKIEFNKVFRYKRIINEYKPFIGKLAIIYDEFDSQGSNKSIILLSNIKANYLKVREEIVSNRTDKHEVEIIHKNADDIIEQVEKKLLDHILASSNIDQPIEIVEECLLIVIVDAFMKCKILEEPY